MELTALDRRQIGRYEIRGILGRGAMGIVYRAYDTVLERSVALKTHLTTVSESLDLRRRFIAEVKTSSRLNHANIVTVFDAGIETDVPFIAMELVEGMTLEDVLQARGRLPPEEAVAILLRVAEALCYAHRQRIVHRDLKPANILIANDGRAKVTDFGIAKALGITAPATTLLCGTPSHMAPEQIQGGPIDGRVDVFALGVVAYETLTGRSPFGGRDLAQIIHQVIDSDPAPPSEIEPSLAKAVDAVIARALAKQPAERYADAEEFVRDLGAAMGTTGVALSIPTPRRLRRSRIVWAAAGGGTLLALGALLAGRSLAPESVPAESMRAVPGVVETSAPLAIPGELSRAEAPGPAVRAKTMPLTEPRASSPSEIHARPARDRPVIEALQSASPSPLRSTSLKVESEPSGAVVRVNGTIRGKAPLALAGLGAGRYEIAIEFPGVPPQSRTVQLAGGAVHTIMFRLSR